MKEEKESKIALNTSVFLTSGPGKLCILLISHTTYEEIWMTSQFLQTI